jgi:ribosomal protein L37E
MDKRVTKICKTCGKEMKIKPSQTRKKMCTECAYEIKKIRSSERYWSKKAPGSTRHQYWEGRYQSMNKLLNK